MVVKWRSTGISRAMTGAGLIRNGVFVPLHSFLSTTTNSLRCFDSITVPYPDEFARYIGFAFESLTSIFELSARVSLPSFTGTALVYIVTVPVLIYFLAIGIKVVQFVSWLFRIDWL